MIVLWRAVSRARRANRCPWERGLPDRAGSGNGVAQTSHPNPLPKTEGKRNPRNRRQCGNQSNGASQAINTNPSADTHELKAQIARLVYNFYDLTDEEIVVVEKP